MTGVFNFISKQICKKLIRCDTGIRTCQNKMTHYMKHDIITLDQSEADCLKHNKTMNIGVTGSPYVTTSMS